MYLLPVFYHPGLEARIGRSVPLYSMGMAYSSLLVRSGVAMMLG